MKNFYVFGGMKYNQNTKMHISTDDGALCGVKSFWMETGDDILRNGYIKHEQHLPSIFERSNVCKKCLKKFENERLTNS